MLEEFTGYPEWLKQAHQCSSDHPMRKSVFWILDQAAQADMAHITQVSASDSERHFMAGRLAAIQDLHDEWSNIYKTANQSEENA